MVHADVGRVAIPRSCAPVLLASQLPTLLSHPSRMDVPAKAWVGARGGSAHAAGAAAAAAYVPAAALDAPRGYVGGSGAPKRRPVTAAPRPHGPSDTRPATAGALRGGDGGGHPRGLPGYGASYPRPASASGAGPGQRVPAWVENIPEPRSLLQRGGAVATPPLDKPKRRRTTRPGTSPGHPRAARPSISQAAASDFSATRVAVDDRSSAAWAPLRHGSPPRGATNTRASTSASLGWDPASAVGIRPAGAVGISSVFSAPDEPGLDRKVAAVMVAQAAEHSALQVEASGHRSRAWRNENEESRSLASAQAPPTTT